MCDFVFQHILDDDVSTVAQQKNLANIASKVIVNVEIGMVRKE
jgi:hypothetical protein